MKAIVTLFLIFTGITMVSCDGFVDIDLPQTELVRKAVFENDQTAESAVLGIYNQMRLTGMASGDLFSIGFLCSLSSDELLNYNTSGFSEDLEQFNVNGLLPDNYLIQGLWSDSYQFIYQANAILEGLDVSSTGVTQPVRLQLRGEAYFIRAFFLFYLTELFGDIPLVTSTDYQVNSTLTRTSKNKVYDQIIADLENAKQLLLPDNSFGSGESFRPNSLAVKSLLARVHLYNGEWQAAIEESDAVITSGYYSLTDLEDTFLKFSQEAIWQLSSDFGNTNEASVFVNSTTPRNAVMTASLLDDFPKNDQRTDYWIGSSTDGENTWYFPYKYKNIESGTITEYSTVLRLAELYLIRAEAKVQLGGIQDGLSDLNRIRTRSGLSEINTGSKEAILDSILMERKREFFTEWGHRWLDLKRTDKLDQIMELEKPGLWKSTGALFPIPEVQLQNNPNMRNEQNPGY